MLAEELKIHLQSVKIIHQQDLQKGYGSVYLTFHGKSSNHETAWLFPQSKASCAVSIYQF